MTTTCLWSEWNSDATSILLSSTSQSSITFLATLDRPNLSRLTSDPILHAPHLPPMPRKLPFDIPKFDGKPRENSKNHVMTLHYWCCSNSLMDDSICLCLFQRTLTGMTTKWYVELPSHFFGDYGTLPMEFLTNFQLLIHYETGTKLLTSLRKSTSTHISDHIYEWRRKRRLIKAQIPDQLLVDWFYKSLFPPIAHDVAMGVAITKEQAISRAQYLNLVYSQFGTLYEPIPNVPRPTNNPSTPSLEPHANGMIDSIKT